MKQFLALVLLVLVLGCSKKEPIVIGGPGNGDSNIKVTFVDANYAFSEGSLDNSIELQFSKSLEVNSTITIRVTEITGTYNENYTTIPAVSGNNIEVLVNSGSNEAEILLNTVVDNDLSTDQIEFQIIDVQGGSLEVGSTNTTTITIEDESSVDEKYRDCLIETEDDQLEVATWNIRQFPQAGSTIEALVDVIPNMNVDIIAVQEIQNTSMFLSMANQLAGWEAAVENVNGSIELGYLYKTSAITSFGAMTKLFSGDTNGYPREAVEVDITHANGLSVKLINIHLKCCGDSESRREDASITMKSYLDNQLADGNVIVLGDFNDDIKNGSPFTNFLNDSNDYFFADKSIADGSSAEWSFPSFPSHIDHILCTDDLKDEFVIAKTLTLNDCVTNYNGVISDHLPVVAVFCN